MTDKETSCRGCKFLYADGSGYSNYTWLDTDVRCALDRNPALDYRAFNTAQPCDWKDPDEWPPTMHGRCDRYAPGPYITLDPDREDKVSESTDDEEQIEAICKHGRAPR